MRESYAASISFTNLILLYFTKESDYRQGLDYNILNIHLHSILSTYILFTVLMVTYVLELNGTIEKHWVFIINRMGLYSSLNLLISGALWSWSQWGTLQLYDIKILITMVIILVFTTVYLFSKVSKNINGIFFFYNTYILYHIPLLKYNVIWSSEIHQKNTFSLIDFFTVSYTGPVFTILLLISIIIHQIVLTTYVRKQHVYKTLHFSS